MFSGSKSDILDHVYRNKGASYFVFHLLRAFLLSVIVFFSLPLSRLWSVPVALPKHLKFFLLSKISKLFYSPVLYV